MIMERIGNVTMAYEEIESKIIHNNYTIIDDHTGEIIIPFGVALLSNDEVVALLNHKCYSLNKLYIGKDDNVHLSKMSVGGIMVNNDIDRYNAEYDNKIEFRILF